MSKYTDKYNSGSATCPYCGEEYRMEAEDYDEDFREIECGKCGKKYWQEEIFSVSHHTIPDCELNDQEHAFELLEFKDGRKAYFCSVCEKCKLCSEDTP